MCFSAEASFTAAGVLAGIGAYTLKGTTDKTIRQFAVIPLIFALQQLCEGFVWLTLTTHKDLTLLHTISLHGFLFFAGIFWPTWVPYLLLKVEEDPKREKILRIILGLGIFVSIAGALTMTVLGNEAAIIFHNVAYPIPISSQKSTFYSIAQVGYFFVLALYVLATIGASFISSIRYVWVFGFLTLIGFLVAQYAYRHAFGSVWCFFAALISIIPVLLMKRAEENLAR